MGVLDRFRGPRALEEILARERRHILQGDIDAVVRLTPEKERLIARLAQGRVEQGELDRLKEKAERNGALLAAAAQGFKAAQARIAGLARGSDDLATYSSDGNRAGLRARAADFNKRA
jgi:hypothetical protein